MNNALDADLIKYKPAVFADQLREIQFDSGTTQMSCPVPALVDIMSLKSRFAVCNKQRSVTLVKPESILITRWFEVPNKFVEPLDTNCPVVSTMDHQSSVI